MWRRWTAIAVFFLETRDTENSITADLIRKMNETQVLFKIDKEEKQLQGTRYRLLIKFLKV